MKQCKKCQIYKSEDKFYSKALCRDCKNARKRELRILHKNSEYVKSNKRIEIPANSKFGRLTVISFFGNISNKGKGRPAYVCVCECNPAKELIVLSYNLRSGHSKSCGCLSKEESGKKLTNWLLENHPFKGKPEKHPQFKHEMTQEEREYNKMRMYQPEYRKWQRQVYKRDNYTCQLSGIPRWKGIEICAHHIESWKTNKELRFDPNNGIILDTKIHKLFHKIYGVTNNTRVQFNEFAARYKSGEFQLI